VRENQIVKNGSPSRQILQGRDLIGSHQAAIALDVSRKIATSLRSVSIGFVKIRPFDPLEAYRGKR
jgi:hypothetical protein